MFDELRRLDEPIPWGLVGGGHDSMIGYSHRTAAARDGMFRLMAGAFHREPRRSVAFGESLGLDAGRRYPDYKAMFQGESQCADGIRAVTVATPNQSHYEIAKAALEAGLHVICEKPLTFRLEEARELKRLATRRNLVFAVNYSYAGYQMIHQAKAMVEAGELGEVRIVKMEFAHGAHAEAVEKTERRTRWLVTPEVVGPSYVVADLGVHIFYLAGLITGLTVKELCCSRQSFVKSRAPLEDNAHVILHFDNGGVGTLWASAVNAGSVHSQKIRVVGSRGSVEWWDEHPNQLVYEPGGRPARILDRGHDYLHGGQARHDRIPTGHAEGYFESWANLYLNYGLAIDAALRGDDAARRKIWYPGVDAGIEGVRMIERCVESADSGCKLVAF